MLKRLVSFIVIFLLLNGLFGCSKDNPNTSNTKSFSQDAATTVPAATPYNTIQPVSTPYATPKAIPPQEASTQAPKAAKTPPAGESSLRFIVMADCRGINNGINSPIVNKTMEKIKQLSPQPEFAVMPGDLCDGANSYSGVKAQLEYFKKTMTKFYPESFFYPGLGNHEVSGTLDGEKAFGDVFSAFNGNFLDGYNRTVYYFDRGGTRFFMLNSNHPGEIHAVSDKQLDWVKTNIDLSKKRNLFFIHEPPYPTGANIGYSLDKNRLQRDKLWDAVDSSNGAMLFCGHEHNYTRRHIDSSFNEKVGNLDFKFEKSVYQVTVGTFGAPLYTGFTDKRNVDVPPISQYHFSVVDMSDSKIKVTVYNVDGKVIDKFEQ